MEAATFSASTSATSSQCVAQQYLPSPLSTSTNIIDLYLHAHCYRPERCQSPRSFHLWACITTIAAAIRDKLWVERHPGKKLKLNLYTMLVGDSGLGKDYCCNIAKSYLYPYRKVVNLFDGRITHAGIAETMGRPTGRNKTTGELTYPDGHLYLITEELKYSLGSKGKLVSDFLSLMTAMYNKEGEVEESTRIAGRLKFREPCWNWLGGTTPEWLFDCIDRKEIAGGAAARVVWVVEGIDIARMRPQYKPPPDFAEVVALLQARFAALVLSPIRGCIQPVPEARAYYQQWFLSRDIAGYDKVYWPTLMREPDLAWKLAALYCVADGGPLIIQLTHMIWATALVEMLRIEHLPKLVDAANTSPQIQTANFIRDYVAKTGYRTKTAVMGQMMRRGFGAGEVEQALLTLEKAKIVVTLHGTLLQGKIVNADPQQQYCVYMEQGGRLTGDKVKGAVGRPKK